MTGSTYSTSFPTTNGAYDTSFNDGYNKTDVFISKLDGNLANLLASTFLGGSKEEAGQCIACSSNGKIYVAGYTASSNFPATSNAYDFSLDYGSWDGFISELNSDLTSLEASTFLGRSEYENIHSMVLLNPNQSGPGTYVLVTGETTSNNFPTTTGAYDTTYNDNGTYRDVFISKLDGDLHSLLASTFLGGTFSDYAGGLALDSSGNVYVTGNTSSSNFPTTSGAYDTSCNGGDAFVSKLDSGLTSLLASTFLGGSGSDDANAIAVGTKNIFIGGITHSSDFPITSGVYDTSFGGSSEAFISKINTDLTNLKASTYLGGSLGEVVLTIVREPLNNVLFVSGYTESTDFPTTNGYDTSHNGGRDIFVSKLSMTLDNLMNSTYLGGSNDEWDGRIAIDSNANVFVTGFTYSTDFPTTAGAYDDNLFFYYEIFVSKLDGNL